jgi:hypothetical protein
MAGSGKTTLVQQMSSHLAATKAEGYIMNLDPAVKTLPYEPNIDIRDTVCHPLDAWAAAVTGKPSSFPGRCTVWPGTYAQISAD